MSRLTPCPLEKKPLMSYYAIKLRLEGNFLAVMTWTQIIWGEFRRPGGEGTKEERRGNPELFALKDGL